MDPDDPLWTSVTKTTAWLEHEGLVRRMRSDDYLRTMSPLERHWFAAEAWTLAAGRFRTYGDSPHKFPDLNFMTEAGIPQTGARRIKQRFARAQAERDF
jgi:hypothetical protein